LFLVTQKATQEIGGLDKNAAGSYMGSLLRQIRKKTYANLSCDNVENNAAILSDVFQAMQIFICNHGGILLENKIGMETLMRIEGEFNTGKLNSFDKFKDIKSYTSQVKQIPGPVYTSNT